MPRAEATPRRRVLVFTKPPVPGRVKTRLIGALSAEDAAELHEALLRDLLDRLSGGAYELELRWAVAAGERPPDLGLPAAVQRGDDLGERLWSALCEAAAGGAAVAAVGGDHPQLSGARLEEAFVRLEAGADCVLGPAHDGGYYLIALRPAAVRRRLFAAIPWSTPGVLAATLERAQELGLGTALLAAEADVDTPEDLAALAARLAADAGECPRTRAFLARRSGGATA